MLYSEKAYEDSMALETGSGSAEDGDARGRAGRRLFMGTGAGNKESPNVCRLTSAATAAWAGRSKASVPLGSSRPWRGGGQKQQQHDASNITSA